MSAAEAWPRRLQQLSDTTLYEWAVAFADSHPGIDHSQWHALLQFSQRWPGLVRFIQRQRAREWQGEKARYRQFYADLESELKKLEQPAREQLPSGLTTRQQRDQLPPLLQDVGREYVQHLWAEGLLQSQEP